MPTTVTPSVAAETEAGKRIREAIQAAARELTRMHLEKHGSHEVTSRMVETVFRLVAQGNARKFTVQDRRKVLGWIREAVDEEKGKP